MNDASTNNGLQSWFTESAALEIRNKFLSLRGGTFCLEMHANDKHRLDEIQVIPSVLEGGFSVMFIFSDAKSLTAKEFCAANNLPFDETSYERVFLR